MIKTKEKGGMFGKALAAACSLALVASLTPATAATAFAASDTQEVPDTITVKVQQLDEQGNPIESKTQKAELDSTNLSDYIDSGKTPGMNAAAQSAIYNDGNWGVATVTGANQGRTLTDLVQALITNGSGTGHWDWTNVATKNPSVTIASGYDATSVDTLPKGVIPAFAQTVETDWNTLVNGTNFYSNMTNTGFNGDYTSTTTAAYIVKNGNSVFNEIGTKQTGESWTANDVAIANAKVTTPNQTGFAFITGMSQNDAENHAVEAASRMVQGVSEITVSFPYPGLTQVERVAGTDWSDTMVKTLDEMYVTGTGSSAKPATNIKNFVVATAAGYEDALAASGFAGLLPSGATSLSAPLLMTDRNKLTANTKKWIEEHSTKASDVTIYLVGGNMAVSDTVKAELESLVSNTSKGSVVRIAGENSWDTALELYKKGPTAASKNWPKVLSGTDVDSKNAYAGKQDVIIAASTGFMDALSISSYAHAQNVPVILTNDKGVLSDEVAEAMQDGIEGGNIQHATIVGGTAVVSTVVNDQLPNIPINRIAGETGYDTSNAIAEFLVKNMKKFNGAETACIATGFDYLDALSSCNYAGYYKSGTPANVLLLADETNETTIEKFLTDNGPNGKPAGNYNKAIIFGGTAVVSAQVALDANSALIKL